MFIPSKNRGGVRSSFPPDRRSSFLRSRILERNRATSAMRSARKAVPANGNATRRKPSISKSGRISSRSEATRCQNGPKGSGRPHIETADDQSSAVFAWSVSAPGGFSGYGMNRAPFDSEAPASARSSAYGRKGRSGAGVPNFSGIDAGDDASSFLSDPRPMQVLRKGTMIGHLAKTSVPR